MKCSGLIRLVCAASVALGLSASAVTIPPEDLASFAEPVILLDISSDATLSEALETAGVTLGTTGTLVKNGTGKLTVDGDAIASFTGEIHIYQGAWYVTRTGDLGTGDGDTFVHGTFNTAPTTTPEQGMLIIDSDVTSLPDSVAQFPDETLHFSGSGFKTDNYSSYGALYCLYHPSVYKNWNGQAPYRWGKEWVAEADTTVSYMGVDNPYLNKIALDLKGHTLTSWGGPYGNRTGGDRMRTIF